MQPQDAYGVSRVEAEAVVEALAWDKGIPFTIVRRPLVYGAGVGGNFLRLLNLVDRDILLPLSRNLRSMVFVLTLCDLIRESLVNNKAKDRVRPISDNSDISTPDLVRKIAVAMSKPDRVLSLPLGTVRAAGILLRKQSEIDRLVGSLAVNVSDTIEVLDSCPAYTLEQGLAQTVNWYEVRKRNG